MRLVTKGMGIGYIDPSGGAIGINNQIFTKGLDYVPIRTREVIKLLSQITRGVYMDSKIENKIEMKSTINKNLILNSKINKQLILNSEITKKIEIESKIDIETGWNNG